MGRRVALVGALLVVAACGGDGDAATTTTSAERATSSTASTTTTTAASASYTVQPGDTLAEIARRFGTTVDVLVQANGIADPDRIAVGQELQIPPAP